MTLFEPPEPPRRTLTLPFGVLAAMPPLRSRIARLIIYILVPAVILMMLNSQAQWTIATHGARQEALRLAQVVASKQRQLTESARQLLISLAALPMVQNGDAEACNPLFQRLRTEFQHYANIGLVDMNGKIVCSGRAIKPDQTVRDLPWFINTMMRREFSIGEYAIGVNTGLPVITYSLPVFDDQRTIRYLLAVNLDLAWVSSLTDESLFPESTDVTVLDRSGTVIYAYPPSSYPIGSTYNAVLRESLRSEDSGTVYITGSDGIQRLTGFTRLTGEDDDSGETVLVGLALNVAYAENNQLLLRNLAGLLLVGLIGIPVARARSNQILVRPVDELVEKTRLLAAGNVEKRVDLDKVRSVRELYEMALAFNEMAEAMEERQLRLKQAQERSEFRIRLRTREMEFLIASNRELSRSLDYDATLQRVANLTVPELADWCAVSVIENGQSRWVALAHENPTRREWAENLLKQGNIMKTVPQSVLDGKPIIYDHNVMGDLAGLVTDHPVARMMLSAAIRQAGIVSIMMVPLVLRDEVSGMVALISAESGRRYDPSHLPLAKELAVRSAMAVENARLYQVSQRLSQDLERRVVERTEQLTAVNQELEAFSYSVSHDLRAPLRAIDGFSQALIEDYSNQLDADGLNYLKRVRSATQRMGSLIDNLLELSRVTRKEMATGEVDLSRIAQELVGELRAAEPQRVVEVVIQPGMKARGDASLIAIVMQNLIGNAWKFSSRKELATIECGMTDYNGERAFFVRDNGAGFDMKYADKLFGAFQRLHHASEFEGNGVGLATVQRIVHRHGGWVRATGVPKQGATFYFTLGTPTDLETGQGTAYGSRSRSDKSYNGEVYDREKHDKETHLTGG